MTNLSKIATIFAAPVGIAVSFTLEVLGAVGAIWGSSEVFGLRDNDNHLEWQIVASTVGAFAFLKWTIKQVDQLYPPVEARTKFGLFSYVHQSFERPIEAIKECAGKDDPKNLLETSIRRNSV